MTAATYLGAELMGSPSFGSFVEVFGAGAVSCLSPNISMVQEATVAVELSLNGQVLFLCSLLTTSCMYYLPVTIDCFLFATCYLLRVVCCVATCCLLFTTCYLRFAICYFIYATTYHLLLTTCYLPLTTYYLPITDYYLLLTKAHIPPR